MVNALIIPLPVNLATSKDSSISLQTVVSKTNDQEPPLPPQICRSSRQNGWESDVTEQFGAKTTKVTLLEDLLMPNKQTKEGVETDC